MTDFTNNSGRGRRYEKIVLVTRKTRLEHLIERFNTAAQAKFYIEHAGGDFGEYQREHDAYRRSLERVRQTLEGAMKLQQIDRGMVPTFSFFLSDFIVTLGQDGLVANTAKYVGGTPILAVNPDAERFDGVLLPFAPEQLENALGAALQGECKVREVTLAEARLNDGQHMLAFNDLFLGARTHISARYSIEWSGVSEAQSSSGVLVATGAGCTGWVSSAFNMASGLVALCGGGTIKPVQLAWDEKRLLFVVREPFVSRHSKAGIVAGILEREQKLVLESHMPSGGVIFSDGIEDDFLEFNSGSRVTIGVAAEPARLMVS